MYEEKKLTAKEVEKIDKWWNDNIVVTEWGSRQVRTEKRPARYTPRRKGARTNYYTTTEPVKIPFKARTLAAYLKLKRPDLKVSCSPWTERYGRQMASGVYYSSTDRSGYMIRVCNNLDNGRRYENPGKLFEHNTTETYRTQAELVMKIDELIQEGVQPLPEKPKPVEPKPEPAKAKETEEVSMQMTEEHREFLNELRESGETNMFGAATYLVDEFGISRQDARSVLSQWMASF